MNLENLVAYATVGAFLLSFGSIAFSARRYITQREKEQRSERFRTYHGIVEVIGSGKSSSEIMPLTSQIAYIYELQNYPEYAELTEKILGILRDQWKEGERDEKYKLLQEVIDDTLANIQ